MQRAGAVGLWSPTPLPGLTFRLHSHLSQPARPVACSSLALATALSQNPSQQAHSASSWPQQPSPAAAAACSGAAWPGGRPADRHASPTSPCRLRAPLPVHMPLTSPTDPPPRAAAAPRRPAGQRPPARRWRSAPTQPSSRRRWGCRCGVGNRAWCCTAEQLHRAVDAAAADARLRQQSLSAQRVEHGSPSPAPRPQGVTLPPVQPSVPPSKFGFVENAERLNSRAAMVSRCWLRPCRLRPIVARAW